MKEWTLSTTASTGPRRQNQESDAALSQKAAFIGVGSEHKGKRVILLVAGSNVRVVDADGVLMCELTLNSAKDYWRQATGDRRLIDV